MAPSGYFLAQKMTQFHADVVGLDPNGKGGMVCSMFINYHSNTTRAAQIAVYYR